MFIQYLSNVFLTLEFGLTVFIDGIGLVLDGVWSLLLSIKNIIRGNMDQLGSIVLAGHGQVFGSFGVYAKGWFRGLFRLLLIGIGSTVYTVIEIVFSEQFI